MIDIWIAILVMTFLGTFFFWSANHIYGYLNKLSKGTFIVLLIAVIVFHMWILEDSVWIIRSLPFQAVVVYGNLFIVTGAMLSGILWRGKLPRRKRIILIGLVILLAWIPTINQLLGKKVKFHNVWVDGVCRQSSQASCGAAAGATLARFYDLETSEKEMAQACLTRQGGTSLCGLYRGLRKATKNT